MTKYIKLFSSIATLLIAIVGLHIEAEGQTPDARYKLIRQQYKIYADGSSDYNYRKEIQLIRNRAITAYADKGETFIVYNPDFQSLTINECYTIRKDGSKVITPKRAFVEQLPSQCTDCGRFNNFVELVIVHTALEYDCTIVLDYTLHSNTDILQDKIQLTQDCPVDKYEIIVDKPYNMHLFSYLANGGQNVKVKNDKHALHIVGTNLTQSSAEHYLPPAEEIYPTLYLSNRESTKDDMKKIKENLPDAQMLLNTIKNQVNNIGYLTKSERNLQLVTRIRDYVVDNIHTNNLTPAMVGYSTASPAEVWKSNCGTPYEKAILLSALFKQAGFYAYTTYGEKEYKTTDGKRFFLHSPSETQVSVLVDGKQLWLSPVEKTPLMPNNTETTHYTEIDWNPSNENGYQTKQLPPLSPQNIDPSYLTAKRTMPLKSTICDDHYTYVLHVPTSATLLNPTELSYTIDGLGAISISVKQSGNVVTVEKHMKVDKDLIEVSQYEDFRKMMIDWQQFNTLYFKFK